MNTGTAMSASAEAAPLSLVVTVCDTATMHVPSWRRVDADNDACAQIDLEGRHEFLKFVLAHVGCCFEDPELEYSVDMALGHSIGCGGAILEAQFPPAFDPFAFNIAMSNGVYLDCDRARDWVLDPYSFPRTEKERTRQARLRASLCFAEHMYYDWCNRLRW